MLLVGHQENIPRSTIVPQQKNAHVTTVN
jgi:hypothetical protein